MEIVLAAFKKHFERTRRQLTMLESGILDEFVSYYRKHFLRSDICTCGTQLKNGKCSNPACEYNP